MRLLATTLVAVIAIAVLTATVAPERTSSSSSARLVVKTVEKRYQGRTAREWASRAWHLRVMLRRERRVLLSRPSVREAIDLACATYGYCDSLWRKADCETGGTFDPLAHNRSGASGLFQFMPSTFASTPYARLSIWSPYASAMAAGWMHEQGRGGEWVCR